MLIQNELFNSENEIISYIKKCETNFFSQIKTAADKIADDKKIKFITLAGPTCAGKSTTAEILKDELFMHGLKLSIVSIDDFFLDTDHIDRKTSDQTEEIDYDSPKAIDLVCFDECIKNILNKKYFYLPKFDFHTGKRISYQGFDPSVCDLIIFEGIQAIYPEITEHIPNEMNAKIFIDACEDLMVDGYVFNRIEIRLIRRIVRDVKFRNADPYFTLFLWNGVRKNENTNIYPNINNEFVQINSLLGYEMNIIRDTFLKITDGYTCGNKFSDTVCELRNKLQKIKSIDTKHLPKNSVYREFLG